MNTYFVKNIYYVHDYDSIQKTSTPDSPLEYGKDVVFWKFEEIYVSSKIINDMVGGEILYKATSEDKSSDEDRSSDMMEVCKCHPRITSNNSFLPKIGETILYKEIVGRELRIMTDNDLRNVVFSDNGIDTTTNNTTVLFTYGGIGNTPATLIDVYEEYNRVSSYMVLYTPVNLSKYQNIHTKYKEIINNLDMTSIGYIDPRDPSQWDSLTEMTIFNLLIRQFI